MIHRALLGAAALALTAAPLAQLAAKPNKPAAAVTADPTRSEKHRAQDESRMPAEILAFTAVKKGDVIGLIEVMKSFHEVHADCDGTIGSFIADNEEAVMAGQPLVSVTV